MELAEKMCWHISRGGFLGRKRGCGRRDSDENEKKASTLERQLVEAKMILSWKILWEGRLPFPKGPGRTGLGWAGNLHCD